MIPWADKADTVGREYSSQRLTSRNLSADDDRCEEGYGVVPRLRATCS